MYLTQSPMMLSRSTQIGPGVLALSLRSLSCRATLLRNCESRRRYLGDTLFMATVDAHLSPSMQKNGHALWNVKLAEAAVSYAMTMAPLVVKDKVIVGVAGASLAFVASSPPSRRAPGKEAWRFDTIPSPANPATKVGATAIGNMAAPPSGSRVRTIRSQFDLLGNWKSGAGLNPEQRPGDNLYSDSAVALDPDTGKLQMVFPIHAGRSLRL